jgi:hypothetical protein
MIFPILSVVVFVVLLLYFVLAGKKKAQSEDLGER